MSSDSESDFSDSEEEVEKVLEEDHLQGLDPLLVDVKCSDHVFDLSFHPEKPFVAGALITGYVEVFKYDQVEASFERVINHQAHKESNRCVRFMNDGESMISASAASTITCTSMEGKRLWQKKHSDACNALQLWDENLFCVGDDSGEIAFYDARQSEAVMRMKEHEEYVSDMIRGKGEMLLSCSGDGTLGVFDIRKKGKLHAMSDSNEDEYLCLAMVKNGNKVLCGSQTGVINIFSWGDFGDMTDRLVGVPTSCDAIAKISEDMVVTGSADGIIRLVNVHPNAVKGIVGEHVNKYTQKADPVERLRVTKDQTLLGSCSHDQTIKIWSLEDVHRVCDGRKTKVIQQTTAQNFFAGL